VAGLDQQPILLHGGKWPDYHGSLQELRRLRSFLRCEPDDAVVVVWGPLEDTISAAEEIRLRYGDAVEGIPHETRQPFPDGSTDFERILPGPDRMYPDTDSPPTRITRDRVARLAVPLPEKPWDRESRYRAVGVPTSTIHFLLRRGGANLVDRVTAKSGGDPRLACFVIGERLRGLRRAGVAVDAISPERWDEFFVLIHPSRLLREACRLIIREMATSPSETVRQVCERLHLGTEATGWRESVGPAVLRISPKAKGGDRAKTIRMALGELMPSLLGKVLAVDVTAAIEAEIGGGAR